MKCEYAVDLIIDSLLDELDDRQRIDLERHVHSCQSCAAEAERLSATWQELGKLGLSFSERGAVAAGRTPPALWYRRFAPHVRAAAAVALVALGGAAGYLLGNGGSPSAPAPTGAATFLLIVRGEEPQALVTEDRLVREYRAWAASLAQQGRLVGGNKLMDDPGRWVSAPTAVETRSHSDISGYFLVSASGYDEAVQIAESSPHIKYGGTFEIRQIDPLN